MDLGLKGKRAIICASSKGLGRACAMALAREGVDLVITARTVVTLEQTAADIRAATGVRVVAVAGDIATEAGRAAALAACPDPDILVNNAGGPPPGDFRNWEREDWIAALDANMLAPIFLIRAVVDGMCARRFGRIVNITSGSVKSPIATLGMSNGARTGLTGFVAGLVGVPIIPLMPDLQGLDVKPTELVQTLGVVLCATSLTLTSSLLFFGLLDGPRAIVSAVAVVPALAGMWVGQQIRLRLSVEQFRLAVFWALLLTGLYTFASRLL